MCDLSSPMRDQTLAPCIGRQKPNHWTTKDVPPQLLLAVYIHGCSTEPICPRLIRWSGDLGTAPQERGAPPETPRHPQAMGQSPVGSLLFSPGFLVHRVLLCPPKVYFLGLCKFWHLYCVANGDLLQEGLCHTQLCCTQRPCPCGRQLPTHSPTGDTHSSIPVSVGSLSPGVQKVCLSPLSISGRNGV